MPKAPAKSSPLDQHAKKIAAAIAKRGMPAFTPAIVQFVESQPTEIFAAFDGVVRHLPPEGDDEALALAYLALLQAMLEQLRYHADRGYAASAKLIATFQDEVVSLADDGEIDGLILSYVSAALHQAKIPASPALMEASARLDAEAEDEIPESEIVAVIHQLLDAAGDDPFAFVDVLNQTAHGMPEEANVALAAGLAHDSRPGSKSAVVLFLLDSSAAVRRAAADGLGQVASSLSPVDLRRLIAMRNWRPADERAGVDAVIRKVRAAGIACAPWESGRIDTLSASAIDGVSAQGFLLVSPAGRKLRVSSILTKRGVADVWTGEPETRRSIAAAIEASGMELPSISASRSYLDRMLAHHLALTTDGGGAPPVGLLQVAETIGGADWNPAVLETREVLAGLLDDLPKTLHGPEVVADVLRRSDDLPGLDEIQRSWFEDDAELAKLAARRSSRVKLFDYLLQRFLAKRRDVWCELFVHTALWMREAPVEVKFAWPELAIVAKALADGRDLGEIALMRDIAERTVAVLADQA